MLHLKNKIRNRLFTQSFIINSLPKSGTHLLAKLLVLLPGIRVAVDGNIGPDFFEEFKVSEEEKSQVFYMGVDWPRPVPKEALNQFLMWIQKHKHFTHMHAPYSQEIKNTLAKHQFKTLTILRDPRDVVVSHANYIGNSPEHFLYNYYKNLSETERICQSIMGINAQEEGGPRLLNIGDRCKSIMQWNYYNLNLTLSFEKLIGKKGGGNEVDQLATVDSIIDHLKIKASKLEVRTAVNNLFGGTATFNKGEIGSWKKSLHGNNKERFKDIAGQVLIDMGYEKDFNW